MRASSIIAVFGVILMVADYVIRPDGPAGWLGFVGIVLALGAAVPIILGRRENV